MPERDRSPLVREALLWFAILRDDAVTDEDRAEFERWKSRSKEHAHAWERAEALWSAFAPVEAELRKSRSAKLGRRAVIGSVAALLAAGPAALWLYQEAQYTDLRTGPGERRSFTLPDGSIVELGGRSSATLDYTDMRRHLVLHRGEAYFTVARDPQRPFVVTAAQGETQALGTRFNIHMDDELVTVSVAEHSVRVSFSGQSPRYLKAGWQVAYSNEEIFAPVMADMASVEAWRNGRLIYHGIPLRTVLNDIERHRGGMILLMDERLGDTPISAAFDTVSADAALDAIVRMLPLRIVRAGMLVVLYAN